MRKFGREGQRSRMRKGIRWKNLTGVWMKIEGVMANPKNRQMWDFGSWEVEFGIGSSDMKYAKWNCRGVNEVSGKTELKPRRYGRK